jgi:hypothetical protein
MCKLYNTWKRAKDLFVRPSFEVYFGNWRNDPEAIGPCGLKIYIWPRRKLSKYTHIAYNSTMIKVGTKPWSFGDKVYTSDVYESSKHKLPKGITPCMLVWNSNIRRKLRKWHLSWIPPVIFLPWWMVCCIRDLDVRWKPKYDDVRYEFPPIFSIRMFGLSLTFSLHAPSKDELSMDDHYWEAILTYIHSDKKYSMQELIEACGTWTKYKDGNEYATYFALRPEYIRKERLEEYYAAVSEIKAKKNKEIL